VSFLLILLVQRNACALLASARKTGTEEDAVEGTLSHHPYAANRDDEIEAAVLIQTGQQTFVSLLERQ
jgi:hypothetical protein